MTFLEIVNAVMRRMREPVVSTYNETTYSTMVSDYVNDAIALVENSWDWTQLREDVDIVTVNGTATYTLTGSGHNPKVLSAINQDNRRKIARTTQYTVDSQSAASGSPLMYVFRGYDSGNAQVQFYPTPTAAETITFNTVIRQGTIAADGTEVKVPTTPVIHLALALLSRERGDADNTSTQEYFMISDRYLADAIQADYTLTDGELDWQSGYSWETNVAI